jgi:hypothetical protein
VRAAQKFRPKFQKFLLPRARCGYIFSIHPFARGSESAITRRRQPKSRHDEQESSRGLFVVSAGGDSSSLV